jgi:hypothetical protein
MEYFVNNDLLANLERLCEKDRPHGIKCRSGWSRSYLIKIANEQRKS